MSTLTLAAPSGSHFDFENVRTKGGTKDLGLVPILVWDSLDAAVAYYTEEGICASLDGTSFRVSFQNIARRMRAANKTDDEIAKAQIDFRTGKRVVGAATPQSRVARLAKTAVEKGADADAVEALLQDIISGKLSNADIQALRG